MRSGCRWIEVRHGGCLVIRYRKGDDLAKRLLRFAVQTVRLSGCLPRNYTGKHIARQLTRSGTSGGANYEEARSAESRADFAHKIAIAGKEVRESVYWLRLVEESELASSAQLVPLIREGEELVAILRSSAKTAKGQPRA